MSFSLVVKIPFLPSKKGDNQVNWLNGIYSHYNGFRRLIV